MPTSPTFASTARRETSESLLRCSSYPLLPRIGDAFCEGNATAEICQTYTGGNLQCINAFPGISSAIMRTNMNPYYLNEGQAILRVKQADRTREVYQDVATSFFLLLAIYFPAVTGIMTGTNMSGKHPLRAVP